jgi:hypothetical protein
MFLRFSEQTASTALKIIDLIDSITETRCVYCAVRIESLHATKDFFLKLSCLSSEKIMPGLAEAIYVYMYIYTAVLHIYSYI